MSEDTNHRISGIFIGMTAGTIGALVALGVFLFVFQGSAFYLNGPETSSDPTSRDTIVEIKGYEELVIPIASRVGPSIVGIRVRSGGGDPLFDPTGSEASGVIYSAEGHVITNQHVVADFLDRNGELVADAIVEVHIQGQDDHYEADLIGYDVATDLALLKIAVKNLPPAVFGDSDELEIGQTVIAIGSPGGLKYMGSVTSGIISGMDREVEFDDGTVMRLLQTDAALNPGNSGGALVNARGEVIGINNAAMDKSTYEGINFAIPSNLVIETIRNILENGFVTGRPWIGIVAMSDEEFSGLQEIYELPDGVFVSDVDASGPSAGAGIRKSDVITHIDDEPVTSLAELRKILNTRNPGDEITLTVYRALNEETVEIKVIVGERNQ
jgi:serine protease Do